MPEGRSFTLTARTGEIPVTFKNNTGHPVRVVVTIESDKLDFPRGETLELELTRLNTTQRFPVVARASGAFPIRITLESPDGHLVVGRARITVRSTAASGVGLVIAVGAAPFLAVWWGRNATKGRRARWSRPLLVPETSTCRGGPRRRAGSVQAPFRFSAPAAGSGADRTRGPPPRRARPFPWCGDAGHYVLAVPLIRTARGPGLAPARPEQRSPGTPSNDSPGDSPSPQPVPAPAPWRRLTPHDRQRVVTDSSCDLPDDLVSELGIDVVPLTIRFGDEELVDRRDLTPSEFWARCARRPSCPRPRRRPPAPSRRSSATRPPPAGRRRGVRQPVVEAVGHQRGGPGRGPGGGRRRSRSRWSTRCRSPWAWA